jgi:hypothetical protein
MNADAQLHLFTARHAEFFALHRCLYCKLEACNALCVVARAFGESAGDYVRGG